MLPKLIHTPSPNWNERPEFEATGAPLIDTVVLHYTGMNTAGEALERLCDPAAQVSAHFFVDEDGVVHQLVEPDRRAWHAGVSQWQGRDNLNHTSIGIEIVNPGHDIDYKPFPTTQIDALLELLTAIRARYDIPRDRYLGHSDVAPGRKIDPGELFPWQQLAVAGFGIWPGDSLRGFDRNDGTILAKQGMMSEEVARLNETLSHIGYSVFSGDVFSRATADALTAFQRHWRPDLVHGTLDVGTQAVLDAIAEKTVRR